MDIITEEGSLPIKSWCPDIEDEALAQAKNLAKLPFAFHHVALMPDSHKGYGMPIGGVLATKDVIIPNAVGVDIGCGMCAQKLPLREVDQGRLKKAMSTIRETIPVGFNHHKTKQLPTIVQIHSESKICQQEREASLYQLGTLGGGNHFIEIQK
jgi:tRNA-splicing ligase RtcB